MDRSSVLILGMAAALTTGVSGASGSIQTQIIENSMTMTPGELVPNWGGTPLVTAPSLSIGGFDTRSGDRTLIDVEVFAKITFSNVRVNVLNVSQLDPGPMVATGSSGFGATIGNPYVLMDPNTAWVSNAIDPAAVPAFGFTGWIGLEFEAMTDLSASVNHSMVVGSESIDVHVAALLDARSLQSLDGSLIALGATNDVADWQMTIDVWAEYTYSVVPAPGSVGLLAGVGLVARRRRR
ncbi:MAG: hypothetical protein RIB32_00510 [Phycisphaerales bacterium]